MCVCVCVCVYTYTDTNAYMYTEREKLWRLTSPEPAEEDSRLETQGRLAVQVQRQSAGRIPSSSGEVSSFSSKTSTD